MQRRTLGRWRARAWLAVPTAVAVGVATLATAPASVGAQTGPDGQPRVQPAPDLPDLPDVPSKWPKGKILPLSVPAAGAADRGVWVVWGDGSRRRTGTEVQLPPATGIPLMADWNGDGVATPGRYEAGQWFVTNAAANSPQWEARTTFGGDPRDVPVTGDIDGDGQVDVGVFRDGQWLWQLVSGQAIDPISYGRPGDRPVVGDWDGDGVRRPRHLPRR